MIALSVNLNKIALIRNSRSGNYPDVIEHARLCITSGAQGITIHPRPDQRHIRPDDAAQLHTLLQQHRNIEFNIEGNPFAEKNNRYPGFIEIIKQSKPDQCTLVPDTNTQLTSDHGFDLSTSWKKLSPIIELLKRQSVRVSLFMDPDIEQISIAADIGADRIELYTGPFAASFATNPDSPETKAIFLQHCRAANHATELGLGINAGHDLNLANLKLYRQLPNLAEVSIGHALTVDAISMGLSNAVLAYLKILNNK